MFRAVELPVGCGGALLLHSMPGRAESLEMAFHMIRVSRIDTIVSLAGLDEVRRKSRPYWEAIQDGRLPLRTGGVPHS